MGNKMKLYAQRVGEICTTPSRERSPVHVQGTNSPVSSGATKEIASLGPKTPKMGELKLSLE